MISSIVIFRDIISETTTSGLIQYKNAILPVMSIGNPIAEIRRSYDRLISTMGFPILVRWNLYIESGPWRRCAAVTCHWALSVWEPANNKETHNDVIKWKHFPRNWPFVRGIHRSPVNSPHKGQWRGALMLCFSCLNKRLSEQPPGWWFETPLWSWWRQCNATGCRPHDLSRPSFVLNTLRPRQNGRHFADDIFKRIFLNGNVWISINISLRLVPGSPIDHIPALVQIMAWCLPGNKPLSEPMMVSLLTHICVTRPQWVNSCNGICMNYVLLITTVRSCRGNSMVVADGVVLIWHQDICNSHDGVGLLVCLRFIST